MTNKTPLPKGGQYFYDQNNHKHITGHNGTHLCRICGKEVDDYPNLLHKYLTSNDIYNNKNIEDYDDYDC